MPRRARTYATYRTYATHSVLALALAGALTTLTACTGSSGSDGGDDAKPGDSSSSASAAPPGKYRTLPEPCGTVSVSQLKEMLPGAAAESDESGGDDESGSVDPSPSPFKGAATVTYDTDRRVGCRWKNATTLGTRHLNVDFERVVSYDPAVSDDEQAERLYDKKASKAKIPVASSGSGDAAGQSEESGESKSDASGPTPDGKTSSRRKSSGDDDPKGDSRSGRSPESSETAGGSASSSPDGKLAPRPLDGIGDTAFINDKLDTADSGLHRDITLVFRTANVIATVRYDQWVTDKHRIPDSKELQDKTHDLAQQLSETFEEE